MRVLIVDNDSEMLENVARRLRDGFSIDIVTGKGDALDLLRQNDLHVVVACEQLSDGSGLDLLSQTAKRWPETLRLFAASADRIALLRGRLGPFKLFQTLSYPIDPGELGSILMLAQAAQAAHADTANVQHIVLAEDRSSQAETPASVLARASMNAPPSLAVARGAARPMPFTVTSPAPPRGAAGPAAGPAATPAAQRKPVTRESLAAAHRPVPPGGIPTAPVARRAPMRRPMPKTADVLPALAQLRSRLHKRPAGHQPQRKQLVLVAVVLGALTAAASAVWLSAGGSDEARADRQTSSAQPRAAAADPVIREVEAALTADNLARAKKALRRLRRIAPEHERLAFFEALVKQREVLGRALTAASASAIAQPTPVESSAEPSGAAPDPGTEAVELNMPEAAATSVTVDASAFASMPATDSTELSAPAETSVLAPPAPPAQTFAGRTLETSSSPAGKGTRGAAPPDERPGLPLARDATLVKRVAPDYPREAAARGTQGFVEIAFTVTAAGGVANTVIMQGTPPGVFDREALHAIRQWRYEPRIENGLPVNWNTLVRMEFKLAQ